MTTRTPKGPDLVNRKFTAAATGAIRVADAAYVRTRKGVGNTWGSATTIVLLPIGSEDPTATVGNCHNVALVENVNGSYNSELIHTRTYDDVVDW